MSILSRDIGDQSRKLSEIAPNFGRFYRPHKFQGAIKLEFLDLHYKIEPDSYHVAKFDGDRPRELGDLALKKKKRKNITSIL